MINMVIHLNKKHDPNQLIETLFEQQLVGQASVDVNNVSYIKQNGQIEKVINSVITLQTKALLFSEITQIVESTFGDDVHITSVPIVGCNKSFDSIIRENIKQV